MDHFGEPLWGPFWGILRPPLSSENARKTKGFEVLRSDNGGEFQVVGTVGVNSNHYDDKIGKYVTGPYAFKVRAFNRAGRSEESNLVSIWL